MPFTVTHGTMVHFMAVSLTIARVQLMIRQSLSVIPILISEWLKSVSPTDLHGRDALDFCNLKTDVPDIVDEVLATPLGTSDHCFVSCVLRVEQSVRSTMSEVLFF